ncbi:hypothetical protein [Aliivibrio wodanis]|uniref:hypothetical protein n=1 Tax=Aliivibrio wodanis TaxID=80852 RepID=UPI00406C4D54
MQSQYWKELYQLKTHIGVIERQLEQAEGRDRCLKIVLAITSSSSIGAWAIWNEHAWLWASIIAFSQIITAVTPFLPYKSRIKAYSSLLHELEELMIRSELKWHSIADGQLTDSQINKARFEIRTAKQKSLKKYINTTIPTDSTLHKQAEESASDYLTNFYVS